MNPFIPKDDMNLPDCWGITVWYLDGKKEEFEGIHIPPKNGILEVVTHQEDVHSWIPLQAIKRIEFDKRFSRAFEIEKARSKRDTTQ